MYVWDINLNLEHRYSVDQIIFEIFLQDMQKSHEEECDCARKTKSYSGLTSRLLLPPIVSLPIYGTSQISNLIKYYSIAD
jgi:hypothetical protein